MNRFQKYFIYTLGLQFIFLFGNNQVDALSCLSPNGNLNRGLCITSCQLQNCATGYCVGEICRCSPRCGDGPP